MRKTLLVAASVLVLSACSAKSVEVATETTMDPTVTAELPPTTVGKPDRISQCTVAMQEAMAGIKTTLDNGSRAYYAGNAGLAEASSGAVVAAVTTAAQCQTLLPDCTTPASQWVQGVKTYAETYAANVVRLARGSLSVIPIMEPVAAVDPSCA
jgi:hypothetical protein